MNAAPRRWFAPARPSPELETFVGWLAETPYRWYVNADGKLRARTPGAEMCAVTGVVRHRAAAAHSLGDWVRAAHRIGLSYADAGLIVEAADHAGSSRALVNRLRRRLLIAARVERPAVVPSQPACTSSRRASHRLYRARPAGPPGG